MNHTNNKFKIPNNIFQLIAEKSLDSIIIINSSGHIVFFNDASEKLFGYTFSEVVGKYVHDILPAHDLRNKANKGFKKYQTDNNGPLIGTTVTVRGLKKNGEEVHIQFTLNSINHEGEYFSFSFLRDVTQQVLLQEKLTTQATTDTLTKVLNLRSYNDRASKEFNSAKRHKENFSLLLLDIDFFKKINDQYGHDIGDIALKTFTKTISQTIRQDDIFSRIGGEEFAVALVKVNIDYVLNIAEKIRLLIENLEIRTSSSSFKMTVSIGVAQMESQDNNLRDLQKRSDKALYEAKHSGRNCVVFLKS
jgi:diguanylate cyclase (GGDEF)-like protein/PAS domain S-box-containing protein